MQFCGIIQQKKISPRSKWKNQHSWPTFCLCDMKNYLTALLFALWNFATIAICFVTICFLCVFCPVTVRWLLPFTFSLHFVLWHFVFALCPLTFCLHVSCGVLFLKFCWKAFSREILIRCLSSLWKVVYSWLFFYISA